MPLCIVSPIRSWSSFNKLVCFHFYLLLASVSQHWMLAPATVMSSCQTPNQSQRKPPTNLLLMSRKILWTQNLFLSQVQGGKRVKKSLKIYLYWKVRKSFWFLVSYLYLSYHYRPRIFWWDKKFQSTWPEDHPRGCCCKSMLHIHV